MRLAVVLLLLSIQSLAWSQIKTIKMSPGVVLIPYEIVSDDSSIMWDARQPLDLAFEEIRTKGRETLIIKRDGEIQTLPEGKKYSLCKLEGKPGETVVVTVFDFSVTDGKPVINRKTFKIDFDGKPDPKPDDDEDDDDDPPDVPPDKFDNIGRRVAQWASGLPRSGEAANVYRKCAKMLREDASVTMNVVSKTLTEGLKSSVDFGVYTSVWKNINADHTKRWNADRMTSTELAEYYDAIANGLDGAKQ